MSISEKILKQIEESEAESPEKKLMVEILQIGDKGSFRHQMDYEALIKKYIAEHKETKE